MTAMRFVGYVLVLPLVLFYALLRNGCRATHWFRTQIPERVLRPLCRCTGRACCMLGRCVAHSCRAVGKAVSNICELAGRSALCVWRNVLEPLMVAGRAAALCVYRSVILPCRRCIGDVASIFSRFVLTPLCDVLRGGCRALEKGLCWGCQKLGKGILWSIVHFGHGCFWTYTHLLVPLWGCLRAAWQASCDGIGAISTAVHCYVLQPLHTCAVLPILSCCTSSLRALASCCARIWRQIMQPCSNAIAACCTATATCISEASLALWAALCSAALALYRHLLEPLWRLLVRLGTVCAGAAHVVYTHTLEPLFHAIGRFGVAIHVRLFLPLGAAAHRLAVIMSEATAALARAVGHLVHALREAWERLVAAMSGHRQASHDGYSEFNSETP